MTPRERWRHWHRIHRVVTRAHREHDEWHGVMHSLWQLYPDFRRGLHMSPRPSLSINGSTARIRWLYRCWRYGQISVRAAKEKVAAAGVDI